MISRLFVAATLLVGLVASAHTVRADTFDSKGWTKLGETTVEGKHDTDVIQVGRREGRFTKLTLVVLDDDLEMKGMKVVFGNGKEFSPSLRADFEEGSRSRAIDLPGDARGIETITLTYGDKGKRIVVRDHRKGGATREVFKKARVQVWGLLAADDPPPPPPRWSSTGWTELGRQDVAKKSGTATFKVKRVDAFDRLTVQVVDGDATISSLVVTFKRGKKATLQVGRGFKDGAREVTLDVPAAGRAITSIQVKYTGRRGGRGGKRSEIVLYGQADAPVADTVDTSGWTLLGEETVDGKHDVDVIQVGRDDGKFDKLLVVALDDDVEMEGLTIKLRKGELTPALRHLFKAGQRSRQIDLGKRSSVIQSIELRYGKTRPRSRARVQIWAR